MSGETVKNTALFVLGMHRSGTSLLAGCLQRFGVDLGNNLLPANEHNPSGFFENVEFLRVHDEILQMLGSSWEDPSSLAEGWRRDPRLLAYRDRLALIIDRDFAGSRLWGVKDPRMCRLLPLWLDILDELNIEAKAILIIRDPVEVAASLHKRNGIDFDQSVTLWLSHVLNAEQQSRDLPRTVVLYDDLLLNWQAEIERLRDSLDVDLFAFTQETVLDVASFVDVELRHNRGAVLPALYAPQNLHASAVFESMVSWRREGTLTLDALAKPAAELSYAERAARPFVTYGRARADFQLAASLEARQQLKVQLMLATQAHAESQRHAAAELARRAEEVTALREACTRTEAQVVSEVRLRVETLAALQTKLQLEAAARLVSQRAQLEEQVQRLQSELDALQHSSSWRFTRPIRVVLNAARNLLSNFKTDGVAQT